LEDKYLFLFFYFYTWKAKVAKKKKVDSKDFIGLGVKNIVGIEVIKLESGLIAGL